MEHDGDREGKGNTICCLLYLIKCFDIVVLNPQISRVGMSALRKMLRSLNSQYLNLHPSDCESQCDFHCALLGLCTYVEYKMYIYTNTEHCKQIKTHTAKYIYTHVYILFMLFLKKY